MRQLPLAGLPRAYVSLTTGRRRYVETWEASDVNLGRTWTPPQIPDGFDDLPARRCIVFRVFTMDHPDGATFADIGAVTGMTKEGAHGVFRRAVRKLVEGLDPCQLEDAGFDGRLRVNLRDMA